MMGAGSAEGLKILLSESGIPADSEATRRLTGYLALLEKWNRRVNLTSSTDWSAVGPMFREGIWASRLYPASAVSHLDIGSGAGFPAIVLKILVPRIELDLIECRVKKSQFLETAAHMLALSGTRVYNARLSEFLESCGETRRWDCISWKALKLAAGDLRKLRGTEFWMFHGKEPAVDDAAVLQNFALLRKEKVPGTHDSYLSILSATN